MVQALTKGIFSKMKSRVDKMMTVTDLSGGKLNRQYKVTDIVTDNKEMESFLFSLGCYEGEIITLISILGETYVINIKEGRYSIDKDLAKAIKVEEI